MSDEILRFKPEQVRELIKQGEIELDNSLPIPIEKARVIFGKDFLGPDAIKKTFDVTLAPEEVPAIPFGEQELQRAKELEQFLILRVSKAADSQPLTIQKMEQPLEDLFSRERRGNVFDADFWSDYNKSKKSFSMHASKPGWALVSREPIPNSTTKNYLDQTDVLSSYLRNSVFRGIRMPTNYKEAIDEFNSKKAQIGGQMTRTLSDTSALPLLQLKLNKFTRQTPVEVVYDMTVYFSKNGELLLTNMSTWTITPDSMSNFISIVGAGSSVSGSINMTSRIPVSSHDWLGVVFSRY